MQGKYALFNTKKKGTVIVHHYIEGTTTKVPSNVQGEVVADETKTGNIGAPYATKLAENVSAEYEAVSEEVENQSGEYIDGTIEVTYYYERIASGKVIVRYVDVDTEEEIAEGEEVKGYVGERDFDIINKMYIDGMTFKGCADLEGVSSTRIRQILCRGVRNMRIRLKIYLKQVEKGDNI